jgi:hypothetical protein
MSRFRLLSSTASRTISSTRGALPAPLPPPRGGLAASRLVHAHCAARLPTPVGLFMPLNCCCAAADCSCCGVLRAGSGEWCPPKRSPKRCAMLLPGRLAGRLYAPPLALPGMDAEDAAAPMLRPNASAAGPPRTRVMPHCLLTAATIERSTTHSAASRYGPNSGQWLITRS